MNDKRFYHLLEGMNSEQVKEFSKRVLPTLEGLRTEILTKSKEVSKPETSRGKNDAMQSQDSQR